jgi:hypothetical protein
LTKSAIHQLNLRKVTSGYVKGVIFFVISVKKCCKFDANLC